MQFESIREAQEFIEETRSKAQEIINGAKYETRDLNETENKEYETRMAYIEKANSFIQYFLNKSIEIEGDNNMNINNETRAKAYCEGIASGNFEEFRTLTAGATGVGLTSQANTIPEHLQEEIIKFVREKSNIVADLKMVQAKGDVTFFVEKDDVYAKLLAENEDCTEDDLSQFITVTLKDRRIGTLVVVTKNLLLNSPIMSESYIIETIGNRILRTLENQVFYADGLGANMSKGILVNVPVENKVSLLADPTVDDLVGVTTSVKPQFLQGAKWYMNRDTFQKLALLKDGINHFYFTYDVINGMPVYSFNGFPIEITDEIKVVGGKGNIVFGNMGEAMVYKISQKTQLNVLREKYITRGAVGINAEMYGDVAVVNNQAYRVIEFPVVEA